MNTTAASGTPILANMVDFDGSDAGVLLLPPNRVLMIAEAAASTVPPYLAESYWPTSHSTNSPATRTRKAAANQEKAETANQPVERPNHSRSLSEWGCPLVNPTKIISAVSCAVTSQGTP